MCCVVIYRYVIWSAMLVEAIYVYTAHTHCICMYVWAEREQQEALCVLKVYRLVNIQEESEVQM
jgi:hypothetical protein